MGNLEHSLHIIKLIGSYGSKMGIDGTIHLQSIEYWHNIIMVKSYMYRIDWESCVGILVLIRLD